MKSSLLNIARSVLLIVISCHANLFSMESLEGLLFRHAVFQVASAKHCGVSEDKFAIKLDPKLRFFALFDGHNNNKVADYASSHLYECIFNACIKGMGRPNLSDENISQAFNVLGQEVLKLEGDSGSTALLAIFSNENDGTFLHIANLGDSTAVLSTTKGIEILTKAHRADNFSEIQRIKNYKKLLKKKPPESPQIRSIDMSRPIKIRRCSSRQLIYEENEGYFFGESSSPTISNKENIPSFSSFLIDDLDSRIPKAIMEIPWEIDTGLNVTRCLGHKHLLNKGLSYVPEIVHLKLDANRGFIILYSDGVGDHISPQDAVDFVKLKLEQGISLDAIASNLILEAMRHDKTNAYVKHIDFDNFLLSARDDMTVIIVQFEPLFDKGS